MTPVRTLVLFAFLIACSKSDSAGKQPPSPTVQTGSQSVASSTSKAPVFTLPISGTPPAKTTKPIDAELVNKLSELQFNGFKSAGKGASAAELLYAVHKTEVFPRLKATITIKPCKDDCVPMDLAKWQENSAKLKEALPSDLRDAPSTIFELGKTDLAGQPMIYTYQLAQGTTTNADGTNAAYTNAYVLYFNDGVNQIKVSAAYIDDALASRDALAKAAPKEMLEALAKGMMDAYTHAWAS